MGLIITVRNLYTGAYSTISAFFVQFFPKKFLLESLYFDNFSASAPIQKLYFHFPANDVLSVSLNDTILSYAPFLLVFCSFFARLCFSDKTCLSKFPSLDVE